MKRKLTFLLLETIIFICICVQQTNLVYNLSLTFLYITSIFILFKKSKKEKNFSNDNKNIIAALTHDLKNPAIAQIRAIELLLKGNYGYIPESQRSFLTDILNSCNTMLDMLVNMLWLYKFDNKKVAINICSFCINELIQEIFKENKLILTSRKHIFKQNYQTAKIYILADKMHIKRIISNLLTNAVNHSKENTTIRLESQIKDDYFTFKVTSEGAPLSEDALKCLFDKDKIFNLKADGLSTGLGLYLSNSLLKLNRGEFFYNSSIEGKNSFGFKINLGNKNKQNKNKLIKISSQN